MTKKIFNLLSAAVLVLAMGVMAKADTTCDLTAAIDLSCAAPINGAIFTTNDLQATGTGLIDPFLRIQANGSEQGYNEDYNPGPAGTPNFDEKTGIWTHSVPMSELGTINIGGTDYYQFLLDINQTNANPYLTMNSLELFQSSTANPNCGTSVGSCLGALAYNLDAGGNNSVMLNYDLNPGSGAGDLWAYIPTTDFSGTSGYLIMYSAFGAPPCPVGETCLSNDGFEEWAVVPNTTPIPEPGSLALFGTGILSMAGYLRRKFLA